MSEEFTGDVATLTSKELCAAAWNSMVPHATRLGMKNVSTIKTESLRRDLSASVDRVITLHNAILDWDQAEKEGHPMGATAAKKKANGAKPGKENPNKRATAAAKASATKTSPAKASATKAFVGSKKAVEINTAIGIRPGSLREFFMNTLVENLGKPVSDDVIGAGTYTPLNKDYSPGALSTVYNDIRVMLGKTGLTETYLLTRIKDEGAGFYQLKIARG